MASFEQHINGAVLASGLLIAPLHSASILDINQSLIALSLGILGGILPDIDLDNSKPIQISFRILSLFIPLLILLLISSDISFLTMFFIWVLSSITLYIIFFKLILSLTIHRGIFHSIPMAILFGQISTTILIYLFGYDITFSTIAGMFLSFGYLIHLILDEIVSLNVFGMSIKNSFGTAFKIIDNQNMIGTFFVYLLIVALFIFIPNDYEKVLEVFKLLSQIKLSA